MAITAKKIADGQHKKNSKTTDETAMQIKKFNYFRNKQHLKNVVSLPCQHCFAEGQTQAAHSNQLIHGKGRGIKASDEYTAALCFACHSELDQGKNMTKEERQEMWRKSHIKTVNKLVTLGLWPDNVPKGQL